VNARTDRRHQDAAPGRRLFVAVPISEAARDAVAAIVASVQAAAKPDARDVRWVRLDGLHLTLRFLGPTAEGAITDIAAAVDRTARRIAPFDVVVGGAGAFPSVQRPRALWLGVDDGGPDLAAAASALDDELAALGWPRTDRPFQAHLTLARSDGVRSGPAVARRLIDAARTVREPFRAEALVLFESLSGEGRSRYVPLHEAPLG
jgi:RNA 2',3'-cyclic 3'-phosphodiesterase